MAGHQFALHDGIALQEKAVLVGFQLQIVAQADGRDDDAHFLGEGFAHAGDAFEQIAALAGVGQADQAVAQLDLQGVNGAGGFPVCRRRWRRRPSAADAAPEVSGGDSPALKELFLAVQADKRAMPQMAARKRKGNIGRPGTMAKIASMAGQNGQHLGIGQQLPGQFAAQVLLGGGAGDQNAGGGGGDEGGNLRNQAVADGEQGEPLQGLVDGHALLHDADGEPAEDVDEGDEDGGDGVAADELARAVHGAVEIGFLLDLAAAARGPRFR